MGCLLALKSQAMQALKKGGFMILQKFPLNFQWPTQEPFLFCVHHNDQYPAGTTELGPESHHLKGRDLGQDFVAKDGFRMYHGEEIPGFPVHPHRGFETITIVRKGYIDHADSLGAAGRYGEGDVQWMTAGAGVQHSEMFPLLKKDQENPVELFQIWLNLPRRSKMAAPHFKMFWSEDIPQVNTESSRARVSVIAGQFQNQQALTSPPDSWAADPANEVCILLIKVNKGGELKLPAAKGLVNRTLYFFTGSGFELNGQKIQAMTGLNIDSQVAAEIKSPIDDIEILMLQAKPIGEPLFQHGPFVMNSKQDIMDTIQDYQRTQFGGWAWPRADMVHGPEIRRFAQYPGGKIEKPKAGTR